MAKIDWTYKLRLMGRDPDNIPMDRLAQYMSLFADLLGNENSPIFKGIQKASTGIRAYIPPAKVTHARKRLMLARSDESSKPGRLMSEIELQMGKDGIRSAELSDSHNKVIYLLEYKKSLDESIPRIQQRGNVDGVVTGVVGSDDTVNVYLKDDVGRSLRLVARDIDLSRRLLNRFRGNPVRLYIHGTWIRTEDGWIPETNKCYIDDFLDLDISDPATIFKALNKIPDNGWTGLEDPIGVWEKIRGLKH